MVLTRHYDVWLAWIELLELKCLQSAQTRWLQITLSRIVPMVIWKFATRVTTFVE